MESLRLTSTQHGKQAYVHKCLIALLHTKQNTLWKQSQVLICHALGKDFLSDMLFQNWTKMTLKYQCLTETNLTYFKK